MVNIKYYGAPNAEGGITDMTVATILKKIIKNPKGSRQCPSAGLYGQTVQEGCVMIIERQNRCSKEILTCGVSVHHLVVARNHTRMWEQNW